MCCNSHFQTRQTSVPCWITCTPPPGSPVTFVTSVTDSVRFRDGIEFPHSAVIPVGFLAGNLPSSEDGYWPLLFAFFPSLIQDSKRLLCVKSIWGGEKIFLQRQRNKSCSFFCWRNDFDIGVVGHSGKRRNKRKSLVTFQEVERPSRSKKKSGTQEERKMCVYNLSSW